VSKTPIHVLRAIWAAARARFGDGAEQMIRQLVAQETDGRTSSTKELTRYEGHRVLDRLNEKDPAAEDKMRASYHGAIRRGQKGRRRSRRSPEEADKASKIIRAAASEQTELIRKIAFEVGMSVQESPGVYRLADNQVASWVDRNFKVRWRPGQPLREDLALKIISALKYWHRTRMRKWRAAWSQKVAARAAEIGLPYRHDTEGCTIPESAQHRFEDLGVVFSGGGSAS